MADFIPDAEFIPDPQISSNPTESAPDFVPENQFIADKDYSTPAEMVKTAAEGLAAGPSFGLSRELESHVLNNAKEQKARIEENPGLATASEFGGILGAPAVGAVGAVARVGKAAEKVAAPVIKKILGETTGKIASKALGSAVEGAFYGAGNAVNEDALGDSELNASSLIHNVGFGTLFGGSLGGLLGLVGEKFSPEAEKAATHEMHIENADNAPIAPPMEPPQSVEELEAANKRAEKLGFGTDLPVKTAVQDAQKNLAGEMNFLPHGAQIASLESPEARLKYKMQLKSDTPLGNELRQYETNQKYEGSQELIPKFIQDIAPEEKLASDAFEGGKAAIDDFKETYDANKAAEKENFDKLDSIETSAVANPQDILTSIYTELPGAKDLVGIRADGTFYSKPWAATSGVERGTAAQLKEVIKALNKDALSVGDIRNLRDTMFDASKNWERPTEAHQISSLRKNLMEYMQDQVQKTLPDLEVRDFMRRYAINEQNRAVIENIFGGSLDEGAKFGKAVEPEKVLPRIFSSVEDVKAAKALLGDKWNKTVANYLSHVHNVANDPVSGFSSNKFNRAINDVKTGKDLIMNEALAEHPEQLQKIRDVTTVMRGLPDSPPGNPSDTASASRLIAQSRKWSSAILHPMELLGHVVGAIGTKLDEMGQRTAVERMLSGRAEENFANKSQKYNAFGKVERMQQSTMGTIQRGVNNIVNSAAGSGAKGLVIQKLTPEDQEKKFDKISSQLKSMATPETLMDKLSEYTKPLFDIAPNTATALSTKMAQAAQFLISKLPAQEPSSPGTPPYRPSQTELSLFNRYYTAVEKPLDVLKQVQHGTLTPEAIEALQMVHPKLYNLMKNEMLEKVIEGKDISYQRRLMMSMFLQQDLSNSLKSQNIASAQIAGAPSPQQGGANPKRGNQTGLGKINKTQQYLTPMQKSQQRIE